jgi:hypothetical protein
VGVKKDGRNRVFTIGSWSDVSEVSQSCTSESLIAAFRVSSGIAARTRTIENPLFMNDDGDLNFVRVCEV